MSALTKYLDAINETTSRAEFARRIEVTRMSLYRYEKGKRRPRWDVIEKIRLETNGALTANDFSDATAL